MSGNFLDTKLDREITEKGYAIVPFADAGELNAIRSFYYSLAPVDALGTYVTMFHPSYDYRRSVDQKIKELFADKASSFLKNYNALFANFMVKESGIEGDFPVHQDWTYVDESKFASYAFWIPVQDVDISNGALNVVPGSHRFTSGLRGPYVHEPFHLLVDRIRSDFSLPVTLRAGEALIWDHRLIHFSLPNHTAQRRLAFTLIMAPAGEQVVHCYGERKADYDEVGIYAVDTDFYLRYVIGQPPAGVERIMVKNQKHEDLTAEVIASMQHINSPVHHVR